MNTRVRARLRLRARSGREVLRSWGLGALLTSVVCALVILPACKSAAPPPTTEEVIEEALPETTEIPEEFKAAADLTKKWYDEGFFPKEPASQDEARAAFSAGLFALLTLASTIPWFDPLRFVLQFTVFNIPFVAIGYLTVRIMCVAIEATLILWRTGINSSVERPIHTTACNKKYY